MAKRSKPAWPSQRKIDALSSHDYDSLSSLLDAFESYARSASRREEIAMVREELEACPEGASLAMSLLALTTDDRKARVEDINAIARAIAGHEGRKKGRAAAAASRKKNRDAVEQELIDAAAAKWPHIRSAKRRAEFMKEEIPAILEGASDLKLSDRALAVVRKRKADSLRRTLSKATSRNRVV